MKAVLERSFNRNQILILSEMENNIETITGTLNSISRKHGISLSTLKLNAKILRELGLISYSEFHTVGLTEFGKTILKLLR